METYDILMLVVLGGAALFGAIKGFAWQVASIGSIVASYFVAYRYREPFSQSISADPPWDRVLAMVILYVGTALLIWVAFRMLSRTIDRMKLREFDRHIGAVFGLGKGILYCTLITLAAATMLGPEKRDVIARSRSGFYISKLLAHSRGVMPGEVQQALQPYIDQLGPPPVAGEAPGPPPTDAPSAAGR
ncbi:CvpA family protein [Roseimaritima sediminicola]|uniref:CvpA family protein n=1 Tax=Roseimaritima sediminicola TaxID=2662066 RepID=UPI0012982E74|nr:CvpA family protein [Roseimaritima sediminicola]